MLTDYLLSIAAGAIQGVTEFLPISSSGHLVLFHNLFSLVENNLAFDVALHFGTLAALVWYFKEDVINYIQGWLKSLSRFDWQKPEQKIPWLIILATLPAVIFALYAENSIELIFRNNLSVATMLIAFGVLLILADQFSQKKFDITNLGIAAALFIGVAQSLALIPGVSRSGITIIAALAVGLKRFEAAKFSFLLGIPILLAAFLKKLTDLNAYNNNDLVLVILGVLSSAIVGYLVIKYFLKLLQKKSLKIFGWYRIALGLFILILLL
ncbi:MAG: undecaprenyl-diphosphatase UppP [Candidatus Buchananbacteria bacterium CG10_big_fil_rev_8_21_14_0_10_42_9]|uniref:Undecaprenyl-diphosphatase n=1 Tax=Candidatus Buchananbacteria bacterium CG10_big_fil_rev_8_21_14_0_10_42_9 TaxID=1974526 RepID=A0A2H0VZU6_9BACT|nr:MAG: undecaprenyl-diphosphatase UppP [Candidatus Buchananbacteria bacterium CG10_big_fil_rev_8_21_14_0_10_42_9]